VPKRQEKELAMIVQIREAIRSSGLSICELSRQSGVSQPQISRFVNGERTLSLPVAARLCEALKLHLVQEKADQPATPPEPKPTRKPPRK
jgi:transcriptional regulator with XRE-family HTH domain